MRYWIRRTVGCAVLLALVLVMRPADSAEAQSVQYRRDQSWVPIPENAEGSWEMSAVTADREGRRVYATRRSDPPILEIDGATGEIIREFGTGLLVWPHGIFVDREGFIWVVDATVGPARTPGRTPLAPLIESALKADRGHQVLKLTPDGEIVMALGTKGVAGTDSRTFNAPTDVVVAPNGDIFVTDGHNAETNARVVKFSKDGEFIKAWGMMGSAPGEFQVPHAIAIDSQGRLFVADRSNGRIQIFDQDGGFIAQWEHFGSPQGIAITPDDMMFVSSGPMITIASAKDGSVLGTITEGIRAEGIATDSHGNIYAAEVNDRSVKKFVRD